jgi:hypothetical protein
MQSNCKFNNKALAQKKGGSKGSTNQHRPLRDYCNAKATGKAREARGNLHYLNVFLTCVEFVSSLIIKFGYFSTSPVKERFNLN